MTQPRLATGNAPTAARTTARAIADMGHMLARLEEAPDLVDALALPVADGFPTSTLGTGGGAGGRPDRLAERIAAQASPHTDYDGEPLPGPVPLPRDPDPIAHALAEMLTAIREARAALNRADKARARIRQKQQPRSSTAAGDQALCENCLRHDVKSIVHKKGRCRACYEYFRDHDRDAGEQLVRERPEVSGRRQYVRA